MLWEDDRWLRSVLENSSEIMKIVDLDGTLRYANPAFGRVFGYDPDEVVGTMNVLDFVHEDDLQRVLDETEKAVNEGVRPQTRSSTDSGTRTARTNGWRAWARTFLGTTRPSGAW
jgi:PAS domain S-box-containing protein